MKKNSLSSAVVAGIAGVAGLAGVAQAVNVNPDGLGQVLLYPYYSVNAGNTTLLSVVNTTNQGKAVKIRFLESLNSAEVLDFNLYMSPFDVWTASLSQIDDVDGTSGGGALFTNDTTCTVPNAVGKDWVGGVPGPSSTFKYFEFQFNNPDVIGETGAMVVNGLDADSIPAERVRQGHFEAIEMGVLLNEGAPSNFNPLAWSTHGGPITARVPANCGALQAAWTSPAGTWLADSGRAIDAPTGGLFGAANIVDVQFGRALPYNADALAGFWATNIADEGNGTTPDLHFEPGDTFPNLSQANDGDGTATAQIFDDSGALITVNYGGAQFGTNAVSAVLMARYIFNEYNMEAGLAAASEWVVTFPTKRFHTYGREGLDNRPFTDNVDGDPASIDSGDHPFDLEGICEIYTFARWDREEFTPGITAGPPVVSPRPPGQAQVFPQLCWESNVVAFNQTLSATTPTQVLGVNPTQGAHGLNINSGSNQFINGWARIEFNSPATAGFDNYLIDNNNTVAIVGLPVIGFWVADYDNTNVGAGLNASFGGIHAHRKDRDGFLLTAPGPAFGTPLDATGLATWTASAP